MRRPTGEPDPARRHTARPPDPIDARPVPATRANWRRIDAPSRRLTWRADLGIRVCLPGEGACSLRVDAGRYLL